jgi:hypothetical protein
VRGVESKQANFFMTSFGKEALGLWQKRDRDNNGIMKTMGSWKTERDVKWAVMTNWSWQQWYRENNGITARKIPNYILLLLGYGKTRTIQENTSSRLAVGRLILRCPLRL